MSPRTKRLWNAPRKIIHIDMDAFYAAIEQRDRPELQGKPVIVGGNPQGRGVVSTASYEARTFGVRSAMPAGRAKRLCPQAVFLSPDFEKYERVSHQIRSILLHYTPEVEFVSLDEAYLDVTRNKLRLEDPVGLAVLIKQNVKAVTRLTASAGIAPNKFLAKIASDIKKPDGLVAVYPEAVFDFLAPLPVRKIPGVGPVTEEKLRKLGLETCEDLAAKSLAELTRAFGKFGADLYEMSRGEDDSPVVVGADPKQIGSEETFERDTLDFNFMEEKIKEFSGQVALRLCQEGWAAKTVILKVKYADFTQITRARTLLQAAHEREGITREALALLRDKTEAGRRKIRLLGVSASNFEKEAKGPGQLELFSPPREPGQPQFKAES